jgi:hypothetical protein
MPIRAFTMPIPLFAIRRSWRSRCSDPRVHDRAKSAITAQEAFKALGDQLREGEALLEGSPTYDLFNAWSATTLALVEDSFGRNTHQVNQFHMSGVGPAIFVSGMTFDADADLRKQLTSKLALLRGWVDLFGKKSTMAAGRPQLELKNEPSAQREIKTGASVTKIFISHASEDAAIAKKLVDLIEATVHAPTGAILCTSVQGYRLDPGDDVPDSLRAKLKNSSVVIGLLTQAGFASSYVLMELGGAWAFGTRAIPLLAPHVAFGKLPGFFKDIHSLHLNHAELIELCHSLPQQTGLAATNNLPRINAAAGELVKAVVDTASGAPGGAPPSTFRS